MSHLIKRANHLLAKTATQEVCWLWGVGDSTDGTATVLREHADRMGLLQCPGRPEGRVRVLNVDTGMEGEDAAARRARGSTSASMMFHQLDPLADYAMLHESDLLTADDVAEQLLLAGDGVPMAGWPTIVLGNEDLFYDIWAYRDMKGQPFSPRPPYSPQYTKAGPFRVRSFGSCWVVPADILRDRTITELAVLELCGQWTAEGIALWCDPRIEVVQPVELWEAQ
jgi:hypothetical protein